MPRRRRQRFFVSRSMTSRHGVGSFMPPFRRASFASSTWSSVVLIVKTFVPGWTRAAVPVGDPNAARIPSEIRSAPAPVAILFSRSTLCGYTRSLRWYAFPAFFAMYRFAEIRAASRAMCRIWHCSSATRWIVTGNFVRRSPISNWLIRICGTPPMYSFRVYAWPRISRYMLAGLRVIVSGPARKLGGYLTLRGASDSVRPPRPTSPVSQSARGTVKYPQGDASAGWASWGESVDNADLGTAAPAVAFALFDDGHERLHEDIRRIVRTAKELALHLKGRKVPTRVVERGRKAADLAGSHLCNLALVE